jgi:hypothetical protein
VPKFGERDALGGSDLGGSDFDTVWLGLIAKKRPPRPPRGATGESIELAGVNAPLPATKPAPPADVITFGTAGSLSTFVGPVRKESDQANNNQCFKQFILLFSCSRPVRSARQQCVSTGIDLIPIYMLPEIGWLRIKAWLSLVSKAKAHATDLGNGFARSASDFAI